MSLTLKQLEQGEMYLANYRNPALRIARDLWWALWVNWRGINCEELIQMAKASLDKEEGTMKEAIEALRGFAPDFPQEPQPANTDIGFLSAQDCENMLSGYRAQKEFKPANCCGNCYYWNADEDKSWGNCKYPGVMAGSLPTYCCPMHERNPDATNA